jgi:hypothetical protein
MNMRKMGLRLVQVVGQLVEPVGWFATAAAFIVLAYLLTAPPILLAHAKQAGFTFPGVYAPLLLIIESGYGGPIVWYFNTVWGAELLIIGGDEGLSWQVMAVDGLLGAASLGAIAFPFWKARRRNRARRALRVNTPLCSVGTQ